MTSLASQLQKLKIAQKDEIQLPDRTKLSFLFDIKQAANIDDQTLYYIFLGGIKEIEEGIPELHSRLQSFQQDLLSEKSLQFYRGTQTKDVLKQIDDQLSLIIKLLAPYFLNTSTHKIIEYLVRIYEINAYNKHTLVYAFLPYFETTFFLRMMQLLSLKNDELFFFLEPYSFKGVTIDKKALIQGLSRNSATSFQKYSEFCFQLCQLHSDFTQTSINCIHWKFFGTLLVEILRTKEEDQTLMYNLLPFISQGMKSSIKDLKISSLMGISQLSCRKTLTEEYALAFFRQVLQSICKMSATNEIEIGLTVLVLLSQFQRLPLLQLKDLQSISNIESFSSHLSTISNNNDTTALIVLLANSTLHEKESQISILSKIFQTCMNLKSIFLVVESLISQAISQTSELHLRNRCQEILVELKKHNELDYNQVILYLLKQTSGNEVQREALTMFLQGNSKVSSLIQKFGDKEYSILSALNSQSKVVRINALNQLENKDFLNKLTSNEQDLIRISISQMIIRNTEEEPILAKVLNVYFNLLDISKEQNHDAQFDILEEFLNSNCKTQRYSEEILQKVIHKISQLRVQQNGSRDIQQLMIGLSFSTINQLSDRFQGINLKSNKTDDIILAISANIDLSQLLILHILQQSKAWLNSAIVISLIAHTCNNTKSQPIQLYELFINMIKALSKNEQSNQQILELITSNLDKNLPNQEKLISKLIGISLKEKQINEQYDISSLISAIFIQVVDKSQKKFTELMIKIAVQSRNELKQAFAISCLSQIMKKNLIDPQIILVLALILLQSPSKLVRTTCFQMIEIFNDLRDEGPYLNVFSETVKPKSAKKASDKQDFTPLKVKPMQKLFKAIIQQKDEIIADQSQLANALNNSTHINFVDSAVRILLDLSTIKMRNQLILSLQTLNKYSIVFAMGLQEQLNKEYYQMKQRPLSSEDYEYLSNIGELLARISSSRYNDAHEEFITSLLFPFLQFIFSLLLKIKVPHSLEQQVAAIFISNLFEQSIYVNLKSEHQIQVLRYYLQAQTLLSSKLHRQEIKDKLISEALKASDTGKKIIKDKEVLPIIIDVKEKLTKSLELNESMNTLLEVLLETITQIKVGNDENILQPIFEIIMVLSKRTQNSNAFYLIELCVQLCIQIIQDNTKVQKIGKQTLEMIIEILNTQMVSLKNLFNELINSTEGSSDDPFKQFLMAVDQSNKDDEEKVNNEQLVTHFQVISSLANLLLHLEQSVFKSANETKNFLQQLSQLFHGIAKKDESKTAKIITISLQLFRFYHSMVLKTTKAVSKSMTDIKDIIATFIDTVRITEDFGVKIDEIYQFLKSIISQTNLTAFASLILLCYAKSTVSVKVDLQLDSNDILLVQRLFLESKDILGLTEELVFMITFIPISEASDVFVKQRMNTLFQSELIQARSETSFWVKQRYIESEKEARRLKYLTIFLINQWLSSDNLIQKQMAYATKINKDHSYQMFYQIYLSSAVFNESISHALQNKDFQEDKKVKKSLKRLFSRIQDFQQSLNNMLSYDVQVSIVNKALQEFNDIKQTLNMRTITLQLLLNKTPQFAQTLSKVQEKEMVIVFTPLVTNALSILQGLFNSFTGKSNNEKQNFLLALLSLLQRTASTLWPKDINDKTVSLVLGFNDKASTFNLMLQSQCILTSLTLFEVHQLDILEQLHRYFEQLMLAFKRIEEPNQDFFTESFIHTLLKASLSQITFFPKFLSANQYEQLIKSVIIITDKEFQGEIKTVLEVISNEATKHVGFKLILQAVVNCYDEAVATTGSADIIIRFFEDLLSPVILRVKKEFIVDYHTKIFDFFRSVFSLSNRYYKEQGHDLPRVRQIESSIAQAYSQFVVKLNEEQLRPLIVRQAKHAFKTTNDDAFPYNMHKLIVFFTSMNQLLNVLREFFVPLLPLYFERILPVLELFGQQQSEGLKRKRGHFDYNQDDEDDNHTLYELLLLLLENMRLNFQFDNSSFIQNDTFEKIAAPISALVTQTQLGSKYPTFISQHLCPTVLELVERIQNDDMWKKINYELLMHTRNQSPQVRLGAWQVVAHLFERVGERYLVLLNDTLPFLSEGMEDENAEVERVAKGVVARVEQLTGDSIHDYLK